MAYEVKDDRIPFYKQYVSIVIIAICIVVMILQYLDYFFGTGTLLIEYAFVPSEFLRGEKLWTIFTSMFMHGDFVHILMNMWFFYVVADNCENKFGHILFLITYLASGIFATFLHAITTVIAGMFSPALGTLLLDIPSLGASGAIFGIIAAYGILFPDTKLALLANPLGGTGAVSRTVKASYFVAIYLITEVTYGIYAILDPIGLGSSTAHWAHVGGALIGAIVAFIYKAYDENKKKK